MKARRILAARAYVLHQRPWRETSRIVEVWSREHGRVALIARGVRRAKSPWRGLMQPFLPLLFSWVQRSELGNLTDLEPSGRLPDLRGRGLMGAFYLNELLLRLMPREDPHPLLYDRYATALERLAGRPEVYRPALRIFEKHLLTAMGYGLNLESEMSTGAPVRQDGQYVYDLSSGPMPDTGRAVGGLKISGRALLALAREELDNTEDLREAQRLMRAALQIHLGDKPMKTSDVLRAMTR